MDFYLNRVLNAFSSMDDGDKSIVFDAKYKPQYIGKSHAGFHNDIRQVSGYARLKSIRNKAGVTEPTLLLKALIIYPDLNNQEEKIDLKQTAVDQYEQVWKVGIRLPF